MKALFYDTETTGLPLFNDPSEDPRQPHIVQLAALLVDVDSRRVISSMDVIVEPDGWEIPADVAEIHGITTELAFDVGIPERVALDMFMELYDASGIAGSRIAHNEQFDARIIRIALMRYRDQAQADSWKAGRAECAQRLSTPILNLPPTEKMLAKRMRGPKSANLGEAYRHFMGRDLEDAHSAIVDARACMDVYFAIRALQAAAA